MPAGFFHLINKLLQLPLLFGYFLGCIIWLTWLDRLASALSWQILVNFTAALVLLYIWGQKTLIKPNNKKVLAISLGLQFSAFLIGLLQLLFNVLIFPSFYILVITFISILTFIVCNHQYCLALFADQQATIDEQTLSFEQAKNKLEEEIQDIQYEFDDKVQERTLELNIALQELEEVNKELAAKTTIDDLTGLFNRRYYDQKISAEYRRSYRNRTPLCLIIIDIDHFKNVNDTYGHSVGDDCLKLLAKQLKNASNRSADIACRFGGEEFCMILPETDGDGGVHFAEVLRKAVGKMSFSFQEIEIPITISCGVAVYEQQSANESTNVNTEILFCAADKALYQAKQQGRNRVKLAESSYYEQHS